MQATNRWRRWQPSAEKLDTHARMEPSKPTEPTFEGFEGAKHGDVPNFSIVDGLADGADDYREYWRAPFVRWLESQCLRRPRWFGGLSCLHLHFCEWIAESNGDPCTRHIFEDLLLECGYLTGEVAGTVLVAGLALREDVAAYENKPARGARRRSAA